MIKISVSVAGARRWRKTHFKSISWHYGQKNNRSSRGNSIASQILNWKGRRQPKMPKVQLSENYIHKYIILIMSSIQAVLLSLKK